MTDLERMAIEAGFGIEQQSGALGGSAAQLERLAAAIRADEREKMIRRMEELRQQEVTSLHVSSGACWAARAAFNKAIAAIRARSD